MTSREPEFPAITRALGTGQIGKPVAVRLVDGTASRGESLENRLAELLAMAAGWVGEEPDRLCAFGSTASGQITALLILRPGQSILASANLRGSGPAAEVTVFGVRGILSWQPDGSEQLTMEETPGRDLSPLAQRFVAHVRQSLAGGAAVSFSPVAGSDTGATVPESAATPAASPKGNVEPRPGLTPPFGVLLVAGDHTHQPGYAGAFAADPRCRLVGLTDEAGIPARRRQLNQRLATRLGVPVLPNLQQALSRSDVHIVCICAEPYRRGRIIVQAAEAGKHLYLDKPLCSSLQDADAIVAAVRKAGVTTQMFSQVHWDPATRLRRLVDSRTLGDITAVHCDLSFAKGQAGTAEPGQARREAPRPHRFELVESKREMTNVGVYCVVTLQWLLGRCVRRVFASTGNYFFMEHQKNDMEDFGQILLEFDGGIVASLSAGRTGWRSHVGGGLNCTCLVGTRGMVAVDAARPRVEVWADVPPWTAPPRDPDDPMGMWAPLPDSPFQAQPKQSWVTPFVPSWNIDAGHFVDCIERGRSSAVPAELAAAATETLLAAYRSAASGQVVSLPLAR